MKKRTSAILVMLLAPLLALAEEPKTEGEPTDAPAATSEATATQPAATAADATAEKKEGKEEEEVDRVALARGAGIPDGKFFLNTSLDHQVGQGTFVNAAYFAYVGGALSISPSYTFSLFGKRMRAFGSAQLSWEYTSPDNINGRRVDYSDIRVGVSAPAVFTEPVTGIFITPNVSATLPISIASRRASTITNLSANVGLSRVFGNLWLNYSVAGGRGLHFSPVVGVGGAPQRDSFGNLLFVCRNDEALCGVAGTNTAWSISNSFNAAYQATEQLSVGASFSLGKSFRYSVVDQVDEFTPKALDSNGNPVARVGPGTVDRMGGSLGVSYFINQIFTLSASMDTFGTPLTNNNQNIRFPFFDFVSGADSLTSYSVTLSALL